MDEADYEENLRALDRMLVEFKVTKETASTPETQGALDRDIHKIQEKKDALLKRMSNTLGGPRDTDVAPTYEAGFGSVLQESVLLGELQLAAGHTVPGVFVKGHPDSSFVWDCVIFVREGSYDGGCFKFRVLIPPKYPDRTVPRVFFQSPVSHPQINELTGELNVAKHYKSWDPNKDHLYHVIQYTSDAFKEIDIADAVNAASAATYFSDRALFEQQAKKCVAQSLQSVTKTSPNTLVMYPWGSSEVEQHALAWLQKFDVASRKSDCESTVEALSRRLYHHVDKSIYSSEPILKLYIEKQMGKLPSTTCIKIEDTSCTGFVTVWMPDTQTTERRWLELTERNASVSLYDSDSKKELLFRIHTPDITRCYQMDDRDSPTSNPFSIVAPDVTLQCGALSDESLKVWLFAIIHSTFTSPHDIEAQLRDMQVQYDVFTTLY